MFTQKLFDDWLDRAFTDFAFCGFYYWNPAVELPPEFGYWPSMLFGCKVPVIPAEFELEPLRLLRITFGSI